MASVELDLSTGIELELLLPVGVNRRSLADRLASRFGAELQPFDQLTKVPLPQEITSVEDLGERAERLRDLSLAIARHHEAEVARLSSDLAFVFLRHRAFRLHRGPTELLSIVHDNTIAGGERVAELVSAPFSREELTFVDELVAELRSIRGSDPETSSSGPELPAGAALHVHVDGSRFEDPSSVFRLVRNHRAAEPVLRRLLRTGPSMKRARPLPAKLEVSLGTLAARGASFDAVRETIRRHAGSRAYGLNVFNLAERDPKKLTVELKLASATLDSGRIRAIRELFVAMVQCALRGDDTGPASDDDLWLQRLGLEPELRAVLTEPAT